MAEQAPRYLDLCLFLGPFASSDPSLNEIPVDCRSFQSIEEELDHYRSRAESLEGTLLDTQLALEEFQASSRELEEEMERELERTEKINNEVKARNEVLRREAEEWK
ncbi:hypothetical protein BC938DRAFT_471753, partial [Jimgerdemannia flammicorona]